MKSLLLSLCILFAIEASHATETSTIYFIASGCSSIPGGKVYVNDELIGAVRQGEVLAYGLYSTGRMVVNFGEAPHYAGHTAFLDIKPGYNHYVLLSCGRLSAREINHARGERMLLRARVVMKDAEAPDLPLRRLIGPESL